MKIDLSELLIVLEIQRKRDESQKGMQPEMTLGCFYDLRRDDDSYCQECRNYKTCSSYFWVFELKGPLFER